jgi:hypothetical protein
LADLAKESQAKADAFKVESEKPKNKVLMYQDPAMDLDNPTHGCSSLVEGVSSSNVTKIITAESQAIWKAHVIGGSRTNSLKSKKFVSNSAKHIAEAQPTKMFPLSLPPPLINKTCFQHSWLAFNRCNSHWYGLSHRFRQTQISA